MRIKIDEIASRIKDKTNLTKYKIEEICKIQFRFLSEHIMNDNENNVKLIYIGKIARKQKIRNRWRLKKS